MWEYEQWRIKTGASAPSFCGGISELGFFLIHDSNSWSKRFYHPTLYTMCSILINCTKVIYNRSNKLSVKSCQRCHIYLIMFEKIYLLLKGMATNQNSNVYAERVSL